MNGQGIILVLENCYWKWYTVDLLIIVGTRLGVT